ncbi:hypothetical protein ABID22_000500 [Pontibacter aydingkolensis]|uniref:DUF4136 domain-containing protein n=1 Tax=Pontibacter aydingkolensis TaxID=1911536 RepID=A0ABS7CS14_9BACT|nr:hypothetical protein [Pontibacter aydingkolensis]MBW7466615.1 hypothetical protein [Pontibacter aydingkolensis]
MKTSNKDLLHKLPYLLICIMPLFLWACVSSTRITGTWKSPEATNQQYNKIVVAALTDNIRARETVENDIQAQLQRRGVAATKSIDIFPPTASSKSGPDVNLLIDRLKDDGYDGIMTVALIDEQTETRYVPGTYSYAPVTRFGWYGRFRGYYTYWYPTLYDPGYYTEDKVYFLETNLYDESTENLVWSAQSQSYSPSSLRNASEKLAEITVGRMAQDGLIR